MNDILIVGDSLTGGRYGVFYGKYMSHHAEMRGIDGQYMSDILDRARKAVSRAFFRCVIIEGGANDIILGGKSDSCIDCWIEELKSLKSEAGNLCICTVTPLGENPDSMMNRVRKEINDELRSVCIESGITIIDTAAALDPLMSGKEIEINPVDLMNIDRMAMKELGDTAFIEESDRISSERGFNVTLDGVHLNRTGAMLYASCMDKALDLLIYQ